MNPVLPAPAVARAPINVSIVEDNKGARESFSQVLNGTPGFRCIGAYASGEDAVRDMPRQKPDVALIDIHLPGMSGIECVAQLKNHLPELQILMLTRYEESDVIFDSLRAGASGYLVKNIPVADLVEAVEQVHSGGAPMSMQIARKLVNYFHRVETPASELESLTAREGEILQLLSEGYFYREIAERLGLKVATVRAHLHAIYKKLHVHSRVQAVLKLLQSQRTED